MRAFLQNAGVAHVLGIHTISNAALEVHTGLGMVSAAGEIEQLPPEGEGGKPSHQGGQNSAGRGHETTSPRKRVARTSSVEMDGQLYSFHEPMLDYRGIKYTWN